MGKKSKRKTVNKKERKERLEERRERQLDVVEDDNRSGGQGDNEIDDDSIDVGDRVWFVAGPSNWRRGVVKEVVDPLNDSLDPLDSLDERYIIVPVDASDREVEYKVARPCTKRDHFEWALRFDVDDEVVCYDGQEGIWVPATVKKLWPTYQYERLYECLVDKRRREDLPGGYRRDNVYIGADTDDFIVKRPASFRFSVGEKVVFNVDKVELVKRPPRGKQWISGTVDCVDCVGGEEYYVVYECKFIMERGKVQRCSILHDDDEHIASSEAYPRQRLFDAIEQGCSRDHIHYLITEFGLDVSAFKDLVIEKAINNGCYGALQWLDEEAEVDLEKIIDVDGNGLLHQIVKGPCAFRFFQAIAFDAGSSENDNPRVFAHASFSFLLRQRNKKGELFLQTLVRDKNVKALSLIFSPAKSIAWELSSSFCFIKPKKTDDLSMPSLLRQTSDEKGRNIRDIAESSQYHMLVRMIEEFSSWQMLHETYSNCQYGFVDRELSSALAIFGPEPRDSVAQRLIRFCRTFRKASIESLITGVVTFGKHHLHEVLMWLTAADASIISDFCWFGRTTTNQNEFVQVELFDMDFNGDGGPSEDLDLMSATAHGSPYLLTLGSDNQCETTSALESYDELLGRFVGKKDEHSLVSFLKNVKGRNLDYYLEQLVAYKLRLLQDDDDLDVRLKAIDFLMSNCGLSPPNAVDLIRWRQCGVLRWLVEKAFIDLSGLANEEEQILCRCKSVTFVGDKKSAQRLKTGEFLLFAAIEFDDLQTVQWLIAMQDVELQNTTCKGWNALHACAYYGRTEISHWLLSHCSAAKPLLTTLCRRKPWESMYAAHLAVMQGFVFLADLLLREGCPVIDAAGKSIDKLALRSKYVFVKKWGEAKTKPLKLQKDIETLLRKLSLQTESCEALKQFITKSRCLAVKRWNDCGFNSTEEPGPLGLTYTDILIKCCERADADFVLWLFRRQEHDVSRFWEDYMDTRTISFNESMLLDDASDRAVATILKRAGAWAKDISVDDPLSRFPSLRKLTTHFQNRMDVAAVLSRLWDMLTRNSVLIAMIVRARMETCCQIQRGENTETLADMYNIMKMIATEMERRGLKNEDAAFENSAFTPDGKLNLDAHCIIHEESPANPLSFQMPWKGKSDYDVKRV